MVQETEKPSVPPAWSIKRWLFTTNHKDVGILYLLTSVFFFVAAGWLALLVRTQLGAPDNAFLNSSAYNQAVTVHGLLMVLWFLSPFAIGFANYIVPLQIGARDLAFPRLNALSYWLYFFSGILMLMSFFTGSAPDGGWTLYSPLSSQRYTPFLGLNVAAAGIIMMIASITVGTVNFIVTIVRMRAPGLKYKHLPMFTWAMLITIGMMLYAFPSLLAGTLILFADRALGTLYFSAPEGGAILWDHLFWFFGHPEVYIVLFPAIGVVGDILPTFTRRPLYGKKYIVLSLVAAAIISFVVWGHHMFITGINPTVMKLFNITTVAVSLPFDVITIAMIETLVRAKIRLKAPVLFAIGSIALFVIGGITGVFLASVALDFQLRGTYWVVSHFHYVMVGGSAMALIGGLYYWFPKITGRMYNEKLAKTHFLLSFIGFNVLYFPMYLLLDMPRRIVTYTASTGWGQMNLLATAGAWIFGLSQLLMFYNLFVSMKKGMPAGPNPWQASTLEWATSSPPPFHNFDTIPVISEGVVHLTNGAGHSAALGAKAETEHVHETHTSTWPIIISAAAFFTLLGLLMGFPVLQLAVAFGVIAVYGYGRERFTVRHEENAESWPYQGVENVKLGVWIFLASEVIFFSALLGAYIFVRVNSATWPAAGQILSIQHGAVNTFILLTSSFTAVLALVSAKAGSRKYTMLSLLTTLVLGLAFMLNKASEWKELIEHGFTFNSGLPASSYFITTGAHGVHVAAGLATIVYLIIRAAEGRYTKGDSGTIEHFGLYWHFVDIVWVFLFPLFYLL
ncbi:MAG: cbb3-type cytochrome c oxidase subunit I [Thaumarchaeota archaeon]|nr:cbb3-type cytochrome c oxidase subunit I [Nitrososphaerota archaeon]